MQVLGLQNENIRKRSHLNMSSSQKGECMLKGTAIESCHTLLKESKA